MTVTLSQSTSESNGDIATGGGAVVAQPGRLPRIANATATSTGLARTDLRIDDLLLGGRNASTRIPWTARRQYTPAVGSQIARWKMRRTARLLPKREASGPNQQFPQHDGRVAAGL